MTRRTDYPTPESIVNAPLNESTINGDWARFSIGVMLVFCLYCLWEESHLGNLSLDAKQYRSEGFFILALFLFRPVYVLYRRISIKVWPLLNRKELSWLLVEPALFLATLSLIHQQIPARVRFALSEPYLRAYAIHLKETGIEKPPCLVGLYLVRKSFVDSNGSIHLVTIEHPQDSGFSYLPPVFRSNNNIRYSPWQGDWQRFRQYWRTP